MTTPDLSLLREAREILRAHPRTVWTEHLRAWTDAFDAAWKDVSTRPSRQNIRHFIACANRLCTAIDAMPPMPEPPAPQGGKVRLDRHQIAA